MRALFALRNRYAADELAETLNLGWVAPSPASPFRCAVPIPRGSRQAKTAIPTVFDIYI
jgi:hypothetical protein